MKKAHFMRPRRKQHGFTMIELVITITLVAIIAALAAPSMQVYVKNSRITSASQELLRSIQTARSEAVKRQNNVVVCASANPTAGGSATCATSGVNGWIVYVDDNNDWARASSEELIEAHSYDSNKLTIIADEDRKISYTATGFANITGGANSSAIVVCDDRGNVDSAGGATETKSVARGIVIAETGRSRLTSVRDSTTDATDIADLLTAIGATCT